MYFCCSRFSVTFAKVIESAGELPSGDPPQPIEESILFDGLVAANPVVRRLRRTRLVRIMRWLGSCATDVPQMCHRCATDVPQRGREGGEVAVKADSVVITDSAGFYS